METNLKQKYLLRMLLTILKQKRLIRLFLAAWKNQNM